jgi:NADH:ubiquinone oxidoreductase subunit 6 (subunit J)
LWTICARSRCSCDNLRDGWEVKTIKSALNWVVAAIAGAVVLVIGFVIAALWTSLGDSEISGAGWLAMGLGVIVTLALGIGLMALVFVSNRRGYDEIGGRDG